jgi:hypothetical protein
MVPPLRKMVLNNISNGHAVYDVGLHFSGSEWQKQRKEVPHQ